MGLGNLVDASGQKSLLNLQQGVNTLGANMQNQQASAQAAALRAEATNVFQQAQVQAEQATIQWKTAYGAQDEQYASSGVEAGVGSPVGMLNQTRMLGQQQVSMIQQQGALQQSLLNTQANNVALTGLSDVLGAQGQNQVSAQQTQISIQNQETQALMSMFGVGAGLFGPAVSQLGGGILNKLGF